MASLVLSQVSTSLLAPSLYGFIAEGATVAASGALWAAAQGITGALGTIAGSVLDRMLFSHDQDYQGPRLNDLTVQTSTEGASLPIVYGTMRLAGNVIWSTGLEEISTTVSQGGGGSGGGGGGSSTTYSYRTDCAVAICEGTITGIRRIWADTKLIYDVGDTASVETLVASGRNDIRFYTGSETQLCDTLTQAVTGSNLAYRGTAYVVFENLALADFGNRLPNFSFEVVKGGNLVIFSDQGDYTYTSGHPLTRNATYQADEGIYVWTLNSTNSQTLELILNNNTKVLISRFNVETSWYSPTWLGTSYMCKGKSDINATCIPIKEGSRYGIGILASDGSYTTILTNNANDPAHTYLIKNGYIYFACGQGYNTKLYRSDLSGHNLIESVIEDLSNTTLTSWIGVSDTYLYLSNKDVLGNNYIYRYDLATLAYMAKYAMAVPYLSLFYYGAVSFDDYVYYTNNGIFAHNFLTGDTKTIISPISGYYYPSDYFSHWQCHLDRKELLYLWFTNWNTGYGTLRIFKGSLLTQSTQTVKEVVEDISNRVKVPLTKYDYSNLSTEVIRGYNITKPMTAAEALVPLTGTYKFDIVEEDSKLKSKLYNSATSVKVFNLQEIGGTSI